MEPYTSVARWGEGELTVWTSGQHPYMVREDLAQCFDLPLAGVRVIVPYVGGGYGSKSYTKIEPLTAALALRAGRPVRLALTIEESILTTRGDAAIVRLRSAFDRDGRHPARPPGHDPPRHRRLRRELAARRAQGGEPPRRPVPDPGPRGHVLDGLHEHGPRQLVPRLRSPAGHARRRIADGRGRRAPRDRSASRSGGATCSARASARGRKVRGIDADLAGRPRPRRRGAGLGRRRCRPVAAGRSACPRPTPARSR